MDDAQGTIQGRAIIAVLKEDQAGIPVVVLWRKRGISDATFYKWSQYGTMGIVQRSRAKALEDEDHNLKKLLAEAIVDGATQREASSRRSSDGPSA
jgi:putative transposase